MLQSETSTLGHGTAIALYRTMQIIRQTEEEARPLPPARADSRRVPHLCRPRSDRHRRLRASHDATMSSSARIAVTAMRWPKGCRRGS